MGRPGSALGESRPAEASVTVLIVICLVLVAIVTAIVLVCDLRRRRTAEAASLQAYVSDALFRETVLFRLSLTASVTVPFWRGSPATVTVTGLIPNPALRRVVIGVVEEEAVKSRQDFRVDDRLVVGHPHGRESDIAG